MAFPRYFWASISVACTSICNQIQVKTACECVYRVSRMAHCVKALAAKPNDLRSIPDPIISGSHIVEGENQLS